MMLYCFYLKNYVYIVVETHVLFFMYFICKPYSDDLIESLPIWRVRAPIFCWDIVEVHLPDRVMRQFGLNQTIPTLFLFDTTHFHHDRRGRPNTNWKLEHAQWLPLWNQRLQYVCDTPVNREPLRYDDPYLIWFRRITRLVIGNPTQRPQQQEGYVPNSTAYETMVCIRFSVFVIYLLRIIMLLLKNCDLENCYLCFS